jgi:bifunctional non-homologous end joining protein LigD
MAPDAKGRAVARFVPPALATLVEAVPQGRDWQHEVKYDGYRLQAIIRNRRCQLLTRRGLDWTSRFHPLADLCAALPVSSAAMDGELVVRNEAGITSFQHLQQELDAGHSLELGFVVFDLLELDGVRWASRPLRERRAALRKLLGRRRGRIRLSEVLRGTPDQLLRDSCRAGYEGVISKRLAAPYRSGRGTDWLKTKCGRRQEFVVLGFTPPSGSREGLGSLLLGVREDDGWEYAGRVGTGFDDATLRRLRARLLRAKRQRTVLPAVPAGLPAGVQWVRPELVVEVAFTEWTTAGRLRHPVFLGVRTDKPPLEVRRELPTRAPKRGTSRP